MFSVYLCSSVRSLYREKIKTVVIYAERLYLQTFHIMYTGSYL